MGKTPFRSDLESFLSYFGKAGVVDRLSSGNPDDMEQILSGCPRRALKVLLGGLQSPGRITRFGEREHLESLAERARVLLDQAATAGDAIKEFAETKGMRVGSPQEDKEPISITVRPLFDIYGGAVEIHWKVHAGSRLKHESVDEPEAFLRAFGGLASALASGWEGMKEMGWAMDPGKASKCAEQLAQCAGAVERLSELLSEFAGDDTEPQVNDENAPGSSRG